MIKIVQRWFRGMIDWLIGKKKEAVAGTYYRVDLRRYIDTILGDGKKLYIIQVFMSGEDVFSVFGQPIDRVLDLHNKVKKIGLENMKRDMEFHLDGERFCVVEILETPEIVVIFLRDYTLESAYGN